MGLSVYMKGYYEEFHALDRRKNKANSKPNKANTPAFGWKSETSPPCSMVSVANLKKQSQLSRIAYCVMRIAKTKLKKQSQF